MQPLRGHEALRRYRTTITGASYFLTLCTQNRLAGLNKSEQSKAIAGELQAMACDGSVVQRAWVIMPDHLHILITATGKLTVGQAVGRLKTKTRAALLKCGLQWQGNYYEHRLRRGDRIEDVLRYLHMNPYQAGLVSPKQMYEHLWIGATEREWFNPMLDDGRPLPEWLA